MAFHCSSLYTTPWKGYIFVDSTVERRQYNVNETRVPPRAYYIMMQDPNQKLNTDWSGVHEKKKNVTETVRMVNSSFGRL